MSDTPPADGAPANFILPTRLDTDAAPGLRDAFLAHRGAPITIDASAVARLGGLCLSVLASASRTWEADGLPLLLSDPSDAFTKGCERLGLDPSALDQTVEVNA